MSDCHSELKPIRQKAIGEQMALLNRGGEGYDFDMRPHILDEIRQSTSPLDETEDFRNMNMTCPAEFLNRAGNGSFDFNQTYQREMDRLHLEDKIFQTEMQAAVTDAVVSQDPCSLPDDVREELMRQKRKDDAFKTALCEAFRKTRTCVYGENCRFAHGIEELRLPPHPRGRNHPKYKTVLCDKFSTTGVCKYGVRCQFIHKIVNPALLAQFQPREVQAAGADLWMALAQQQIQDIQKSQPMASLNQSLYTSSSTSSNMQQQQNRFNNHRNVDLNQSMPMGPRREDLARAFARAADQNPCVSRLARAVENRHNQFLGWGFN